jgi:hypothetical protein
MKKVLMCVLFLTTICSTSFAAFSGVSRATITACAVFTSGGVVSFDYQLRNLSDNNTTSWIYWDTSVIAPGVTAWKVASSYILLESTITNASGGIQIYTDNKAADANPAYTGSGNPAGLVAEEAPADAPLPMCWRITDLSTGPVAGLNIAQVNRAGVGVTTATLYCPDLETSTNPPDYQYPCFFWMTDRQTAANASAATSAFADGADYITVKDKIRGIHHAEGPNWGTTSSPDYVYIGACFTNASTPRTYKTSTLRIEAFTE